MKPLALLLVAAAAHAKGLIREEQTIEISGVKEVWRLQWKSPPRPACDPTDMGWMTCPCVGFAFGESGSLDLVRLRQGREYDRLPLAPLFDGETIVQRWQTSVKDMDDGAYAALLPIVAKRPLVTLMNFADYDHDGKATEFYLQTSAGPCVRTSGVIIVVSASNPKLHSFRSATNPVKPLFLQKEEWQALLNAQGSVRVVDWACGDHGSEQQFELPLHATPEGIDLIQETYACPRADNARPLKKEPQ